MNDNFVNRLSNRTAHDLDNEYLNAHLNEIDHAKWIDAESLETLPKAIVPEADASLSVPHSVLVVEDDAGQREISLQQSYYTLGRDARNDICLRSQYASRYHAVLRRIDTEPNAIQYKIVDGDVHGNPSTNGILVNGKREHACTLKSGDSIILGPQVRLIYRTMFSPPQSPINRGL